MVITQQGFGELEEFRVRRGAADRFAEGRELQVDVAIEAGRVRRTGSPRL
jgi:hypothetical protein